MACYHFTIKHDKKPTGEQISAATHVDYIERDGKFKNIDEERQIKDAKNIFNGNAISAVGIHQIIEDTNRQILYKSQYGNIAERDNVIETTDNASLETIQIAMLLAMKKYGENLEVQGTIKYKAQTIAAAIEMELPIKFTDKAMEQKRVQLMEEQVNGRNKPGTRSEFGFDTSYGGSKFYNESGFEKDMAQYRKKISTQRRHDMPSLSSCDVVRFSEGTEMFMHGNKTYDMVSGGNESHTTLRRVFSRNSGTKINAEIIADNILAKKQILAAEHVQYINREANFSLKGGCIHTKNHLPQWAEGSARKFFEAADLYEHARNTRYREIEFALPVELNKEQQIDIVNEFIDKHLGKEFYWALAIHDKQAAMGNGEKNPHVHIMFSERKLDDIEREKERNPEIFFKGYNRYHPENGGCRKDEKWNGGNRSTYTVEMRKDFALIQNSSLEKYGFDIRVDYRSLEMQRLAALERGDLAIAEMLNRKPEKHIGPDRANQDQNARVIEIQQFRQLKKEHQQLLLAAEVLQKSIIKDEMNQSVNETITEANSSLSEIRKNDFISVNLTESLINTSRELAAVRDMIIWDAEALATARRKYMTPEELQIEKNAKLISEERFILNRLDKELIKPEAWNQAALIEYTNTKNQIASRLSIVNNQAKEISSLLQVVNNRFTTPDYKVKITKIQREILQENQPIKDRAIALQKKLHGIIEQTKILLRDQVAQRSLNIEEKIAQLLAPLYIEKTAIAKQRQILAEDIKDFSVQKKPAFYMSEYIAWNKEQAELARRENQLILQDNEIDKKISTLKESIRFPAKNQDVSDQSNETIKQIRLTARQIQEILRPEIRSLKYEHERIEAAIKKIEPTVISDKRAIEMAKNIFVGGAFKEARSEQAEIKKEVMRLVKAEDELQKARYEINTMQKPKWYQDKTDYNAMQSKLAMMEQTYLTRSLTLEQRKSGNEQQFAGLEAQCNTPNAQAQIAKIAAGILKKNEPTVRNYDTLKQQKIAISEEITYLTKLKIATDKQISYDAATKTKAQKIEPTYSIKDKNNVIGGGNSSGNAKSILIDFAKTIADTFAGEGKAANLVVKFEGNNQYDFAGMTEEQIQTAIKQITIQQSL